MKNKKLILAITMGDAAGIGPEIILKLFNNYKIPNNTLPFIIGNFKWMDYVNKKLNYNASLKKISEINELSKFISDDSNELINIIPIYDKEEYDLASTNIGNVNAIAGKCSGIYIETAVSFALDNLVSAIITCPINKDSLNKGGYKFQGHTQMLAALTNSDNYVMMLMGKWLKTVLVTTHIALKDVSSNISIEKIVNKVLITNNSLKKDFNIKNPSLAVLALNPHCGENGLMGNEEDTIIKPALNILKSKNINVSGPFSADTFFSYAKDKFDAVVCMYHDQGLIPLKLISFGKGVNVTLGLPIVRTSVDHGTGYDIVHKNTADAGSLFEALKTAAIIAENRLSL